MGTGLTCGVSFTSGCVLSGSMAVLGVGAVGVLALLGVDASELLRDRWWSGELGSSRLQS